MEGLASTGAALEPPVIAVGSEIPLVVVNVASALSLEVLLEYVLGVLEESVMTPSK